MPMTPRSNSSSTSAARDLGVLVHLADERPDLGVGELAHAVAKDDLVFGEHGQRLGVIDGIWHGAAPELMTAGGRMLSLAQAFEFATS